jgi:alkanesulfonate monooxygenase SsuD/methylene tetrahydromethanopterin reductase-like flavin-dependent oxidoreductase (luciferase family)
LNFIEDCGLMVEPQEGKTPGEIVDVASFAEKKGFGYFFRSDHLLPTTRTKGLDSPECWVTLGAVAARTRRIRFGPMVSPIGFRNPALLARMAQTVDALSRGRLRLGVGAGWYGDEYAAHGYEFPDLKTRKLQFREALEIIRPLTQAGRVDFEGDFFSAHLGSLPRLKNRIHLIVGGRLPSIVKLTAEFGDEWNFYGGIPRKFEEVKAFLDSSGRRIAISRMGPFIVAETAGQLRTKLRTNMRQGGTSGDEDAHLRKLRKSGWIAGTAGDFPAEVGKFREKGVERFYFQAWETKERGEIELLSQVLKNT